MEENKGSGMTEERMGVSGRDPGQVRREYRSYAGRICSYLGFALCFLFVILQGVDLLFYLAAVILYSFGQGASEGIAEFAIEVSDFLVSDAFSIIGISIISYGVAVLVMKLFLRKIPEIRVEPKRMRISKFIMFFVLAMGGGYIFNLVGSGINALLAGLTQRGVEQLNPAMDMMENISWPMLVYASIIAPVCEEFVFRKMILNRARPLGEKAAVIFSAIMFGMMHGNIAQFLYATVIGLVLGYMAVKTGRIIYGIVLHIMVNSYSSIIATGLYTWIADNMVLTMFLSFFVVMVMLAMIVGAAVIVIVQCRKVRWKRGNAPYGVEYRDYSSAMFLNPGVISFLVLSFAMILFFALWS